MKKLLLVVMISGLSFASFARGGGGGGDGKGDGGGENYAASYESEGVIKIDNSHLLINLDNLTDEQINSLQEKLETMKSI